MKNYVVITGASYGIGEALAYKSVKEGYNLILIARNEDKLNEIKNKILQNNNVDIIVIKCDLTKGKEISKMIEQLDKYEVEILINNAGFGYYHSVCEQDEVKVDSMIDLNIKALVKLSTYFVNKYSKTKDNKYLLNVSSSGGYVNVPNAVTYCATKFFVSSFTEGLAKELERENSKLYPKVFAPSVTETNFGKVASGNEDYNYKQTFEKYNTSLEIADYIYELINSNYIVGYINRDTYEFEKSDIKFDFDYSRLK